MRKIWYLEILRVISMLAVVFTHIGSTVATDFAENFRGIRCPQKVRLFNRSSFNGCYAIFMQPRG